MKDTLRDDCSDADNCVSNCCASPILSPIFFVVFVLISQFVLVNVVVAVLMKHLEESNKKDAEPVDKVALATGTDTERNRTDTEAELDNVGEEEEEDALDMRRRSQQQRQQQWLGVHRLATKQVSLPPELPDPRSYRIPPPLSRHQQQSARGDAVLANLSLPDLPFGDATQSIQPPPYETALAELGDQQTMMPRRHCASLYARSRPRPRPGYLSLTSQPDYYPDTEPPQRRRLPSGMYRSQSARHPPPHNFAADVDAPLLNRT